MQKMGKENVGKLLCISIMAIMILPAGAATLMVDTDTFAGDRHFIINMEEPILTEWQDALDQTGIDIITYLPGEGYEARMTYEEMLVVDELSFVRCVNEYPLELKISPDIDGDEVFISLINSDTMDQTLASLSGIVQFMDGDYTSVGYLLKARLSDMGDVFTVAEFADVHYIEPYRPEKLHGEMGMQIIGGGAWIMDDDANPSTPYRATGDFGAYVNHLGWTGNGVGIAIADTGLGDGTAPTGGHNDYTGRVLGGYDFGTGGWEDQHGHGTHCAGLIVADGYNGNGVTYDGHGPYYVGMGLAYEASIYAEQIFEGSSGSWVGPADYRDIVTQGYAGGTQIHSDSWGSSTGGAYSAHDEAYDQTIRDADPGTPGNQQYIVVTSASNDGPNTNSIGSPGNAKNIITVGSYENYMPDQNLFGSAESGTSSDDPDTVSSFSSRGWTDDGRIKPDLVAEGQGTISLSSPLVSDGLYRDYDPDTRYTWCSGTSQSCPSLAGGIALIYEWYDTTYGVPPTPATAKACAINSAQDIGTADIPNQNEGWGRMFLPDLMDAPAPHMIFQDPTLLTTGVTDEYTFSYVNAAEPVKITLAYTDTFALSGANPSLKNQVNLEVVSPLGTIYHGNAFSNGFATTGNPIVTFDTDQDGYDDRNNVECVYFSPGQLEIGQYTVRIIGTNVPTDCNNDGSNNQDYSLVMYNCEDVSEKGTIDLDENVYAGEDMATITVGDTDLNTNTNVQTTTITVTSTSEPGGESVTLTETGGDTSVFVGTITLSMTDGGGILQVAHDDIVTATYNDAFDGSGPATVTDTAIVDAGVASTSGLTVDWWAPGNAEIETRFMRSESSSVNGLTADNLAITQGTTSQLYTTANTPTMYAGIRVWTRTSGGTETEVTGGTPVGIASTSTSATVSGTWDCPETTMANTDSIVVRMYCDGANPPGTLVESFTTEVLGATQLDASTWTTSYYMSERNNADRIYWGSSTYNTRIDNFAWSAMTTPTDHNTLNWTLSGDDGAGADDVAQYNIYRSINSGGPWDAGAYIDNVATGIGTYTDLDRGIPDGIQWWYVVKAEDGAGNLDTNTNAVPEPGSIPDSAPISSASYAGASPTPNNPVTIDWTATDDIDLTQIELFY
ncbi:MAG: S8 family serine peptidase, partial [Thermoplasmata archaeon]|nr:S8 family serine peptidase [Thermoplasmata archaeon]